MRIVDAHHHLWDPGALDYALLKGASRLAPIAVPHRAADFDAVARANGVTAAVAIEAASAGADHEAESAWLFAEVARSSITRCVVAYAPVERGDVGAWLDRLIASHGPRLAGIRRTFESVPPGFAYSDAVVAGVREVARRGLPFDLVLFADRLPDVIELVRRVPEATFVLDHLGKPPLERKVQGAWKQAMAELGRLPNVAAAKISGLVTEAADGRWDDALVRPYVEHSAVCFGWERLMFGSDWPVCNLAGGYRRWLDFAMSVCSHDAGAAASFFAGTAERIYSIAADPPA
jgi:L-fuconolactonase